MTVNQLQHGIRINLYGNQSLSKYEVNTLSNGKCEDVEIFWNKDIFFFKIDLLTESNGLEITLFKPNKLLKLRSDFLSGYQCLF